DLGDKGDKGDKGLPGDKGDTGPQGSQGLKGDKGDLGPQGLTGLKGDKGDLGDKGDKGDKGLPGDKGDLGPQGLTGLKGDKGDLGDKGDKGDLGDLGPPGLQGLPGPPGLPGTSLWIDNLPLQYVSSFANVGFGTLRNTNILTVAQRSRTDPIADAWTTYSSRRWKTNIVPIDGALDKVMRLRGVYYDWKVDGKHDVGLIAEEVGEVIPEIVAYEENGIDAQSVDYARLVALLIEGMKEQQKEIEALKAALSANEIQSQQHILQGQ
ncbi:tail fiber domain-containing protein, partial [Candidatus Neomarinimicrobiota bacterium]